MINPGLMSLLGTICHQLQDTQESPFLVVRGSSHLSQHCLLYGFINKLSICAQSVAVFEVSVLLTGIDTWVLVHVCPVAFWQKRIHCDLFCEEVEEQMYGDPWFTVKHWEWMNHQACCNTAAVIQAVLEIRYLELSLTLAWKRPNKKVNHLAQILIAVRSDVRSSSVTTLHAQM